MSDEVPFAGSELDRFLEGVIDTQELPGDYIRIISSMAGVRDFSADPAHEVDGLPGYRLNEVLDSMNLTWNNQTEFWAGETKVDVSYIVPVNTSVIAQGVLKGG